MFDNFSLGIPPQFKATPAGYKPAEREPFEAISDGKGRQTVLVHSGGAATAPVTMPALPKEFCK